jgi:hypothetical protein
VTALSLEGAVTRLTALSLQSCPASNYPSGRRLPSLREGERNLVFAADGKRGHFPAFFILF